MKKTTIVLLLILLTCFSINAQSPPTAICQNITVQLDGTGNVTITPEQVDNGSNDGLEGPVTLSLDITTFGCADVGTPVTVTLTVTDNDDPSQTDTCTATVTVEDKPLPTITNLPDLTDPCYVEVVDIPTATDCDGTISALTGSPLSYNQEGTYTIVWTYIDSNSNIVNQNQTVIIDEDSTDPIPDLVSLPDINSQCEVNSLTPPTATDDCSLAVAVSNNATFPITTSTTITWTYDDGNGNTVTQDQNINILGDTTDPTASNPTAVNVQCSADVPAVDIADVTDEADNCSLEANITVAHVSDVSDGNSNPEVITRTYSVTDEALNSINVTQIITVDDTTDPTASNPTAVNVQCSADVPAVDIADVTDEADNCSLEANITVAHVSDVSDGNSNPEVITRTYSVTDEALNSINVTQTITVDDTTDPTASNPTAVNVQCSADVPAVDIADVTDEADNCSLEANITVAHVSDVSDGNSNPEVITRTYSVTDEALNSINVTQIITVDDTTDPTASNPTAVNVQCSADVPAVDIADVTDEADNCSLEANITVAHVSDVSDGNSNPEVITRTYSVTDEALNSINVTQIITVDDTTDPTASNPTAVNVQCSADVPAVDIADVTDEADNCSLEANITVAHVSDVSDGNSNPEVITRTYSVTDEALNSINVTQIITVDDTTDPTASNPTAVNVQCSADVPAVDIADVTDEADNCSLEANITVAHVSDVSDGNSNPEVITRTYSVTDEALNSINVTQIITVDDTTDPTASNPTAVNVQCSADVPAVDIADVTDEADNCSLEANITVAHVSDVSDGNSNPEVITRTYSVTDEALNSINVTQIITVDDTTDPTASNPTAVNVQCSADVPAVDIADVTDEADNCSLEANITVAHVSDVSDGNSNPEVITRTYSVTDEALNSINVTQIITVDDTTDPTASNPTAVNVQCSADVPAVDIADVTDEADNCSLEANITVAHVSDVSDGNSNPEVITRTYSVTDEALNSINVTQIITVDDTTDPTASNPTAVNVQCSADVPAVDIADVTDEADNCSLEANITVAHVSDVSDGNSNPEVITRTYSVTDEALNSINVTQIITVDDTTDPTASNPTAVNVQCSADVPAVDIADVTDEADNCSLEANITVAHVSDVSDGNSNPEVITRTYSVTDEALNSINVTQIITVDDTTDPTASNPTAVNVQCSADVPAVDIADVTDEADNCSLEANITVAHVSDVSDGNSNPEVITRTYSVTDEALNSINVTQIITVDDTTDPTASNPTAVNVQCSADVPAVDIADVTDEADNCSLEANITVAHVSDVSDGNSNPEVITRTYSVTDEALNSINVTQIITVDDTTDPVCAATDITIDLAGGTVTITGADIDNGSSDNCGIASLVANPNTFNSSDVGPNTVTLTVTDVNGNSSSCDIIVTVEDRIQLSAKIFLQGPYDTNTGLMTDALRNNGSIPETSPYTDALTINPSILTVTAENAIIDWVWLELRDKTDGTTVVLSRSALIQADGDIVDVDGLSSLVFDVAADDYYVVISHRNHLGIRSANAISLNGGAQSIDLTGDSNLILGGANAVAELGDGKLGLFTGDFDGNGQVQNSDLNGILPLLGTSSYSFADLDMNGQIQNTDINILLPNLGLGSNVSRTSNNTEEPKIFIAPRRE